MDSIHIGPVFIPLARFAIALGLIALIVTGEILGRRVDGRFSAWGWNVSLLGLIVARLAFVAQNAQVYAEQPLSVLYIWQGGFDPVWGLVGGVLYTVWHFRRHPALYRWALVPALAGGLAWLTPTLVLTGGDAGDAQAVTLPSVTLETLDGEPVDLADFTGRPVVLNVWATWCPPCRREMPVFQRAQQQREDLVFLFADQGEARETVVDFLKSQELTLDNVLLDPGHQVSQALGVPGFPTTLFFDSRGRLVDAHLGEVSRAALEGYLNRLD